MIFFESTVQEVSHWTCRRRRSQHRFMFQKTALVFALKSEERRDRLIKPSMLTFWEIMSDGLFESDSCVELKKPDFFFGDAIAEDERTLYDMDYKWLRQIGERKFFLPNMERMYTLAFLQHMSVYRTMEWDLSKSLFGVSLGKLGVNEAYPAGYGRDVLGLQHGLVRAEYPEGETHQLAATFIN